MLPSAELVKLYLLTHGHPLLLCAGTRESTGKDRVVLAELLWGEAHLIRVCLGRQGGGMLRVFRVQLLGFIFLDFLARWA